MSARFFVEVTWAAIRFQRVLAFIRKKGSRDVRCDSAPAHLPRLAPRVITDVCRDAAFWIGSHGSWAGESISAATAERTSTIASCRRRLRSTAFDHSNSSATGTPSAFASRFSTDSEGFFRVPLSSMVMYCFCTLAALATASWVSPRRSRNVRITVLSRVGGKVTNRYLQVKRRCVRLAGWRPPPAASTLSGDEPYRAAQSDRHIDRNGSDDSVRPNTSDSRV